MYAFKIKFQDCGEEERKWCNTTSLGSVIPRYLETLAPDGDKSCVARDAKFSKDIFQLVSGYYCCFYTNSVLLNVKTTLCIDLCINSRNAIYPCFWVSKMQF